MMKKLFVMMRSDDVIPLQSITLWSGASNEA